jgi:hypothetical protein
MKEGLGVSRGGLASGCLFHVTTSTTNPKLVLFGIIQKGVDEGIPHPFPDVPVHIVKAPGVRQFEFDRMNASYAVHNIPCMFMQFGRILAKIIVGGGASPAGIFPFDFGGKTEFMIFGKLATLLTQDRQSLAKLHGVQPGNPVHG